MGRQSMVLRVRGRKGEEAKEKREKKREYKGIFRKINDKEAVERVMRTSKIGKGVDEEG